MLAIAHFSIGMAGALVVMLLFSKTYTLKYDLLIVFLSGMFALLPDIVKLWGSKAHHPFWMNVFWFHTWLDTLPDNVAYASIAFLIAGVMLGIYYYFRIM